MSGVVKVIELVGWSGDSWQKAVDNAVTQAAKTLDAILGVEVVGWTADVENGQIVAYKANVKVAFKVRGSDDLR